MGPPLIHHLTIPPDAWEWRENAACLGLDHETFFVPESDTEGTEQARAVCRPCPVREDCLTFALKHRQDYGIWGGLTEAERHNLRRVIRQQQRARTHSKAGRA